MGVPGQKSPANLKKEQAAASKPGKWVVDANGNTVFQNLDGTQDPLSPDQQFQTDFVTGQDPSKYNPVYNPYSKADPREQFSTQAVGANVKLAQQVMAEQPGQDAYTVNPTYMQAMGWNPADQYQYET